jgi:hypothetical protein
LPERTPRRAVTCVGRAFIGGFDASSSTYRWLRHCFLSFGAVDRRPDAASSTSAPSSTTSVGVCPPRRAPLSDFLRRLACGYRVLGLTGSR